MSLLGKPVDDAAALCVPTAVHPFPGRTGKAWQAIAVNGHAVEVVSEGNWSLFPSPTAGSSTSPRGRSRPVE